MALHKGDKSAAITGMIVTALALAGIAYGLVLWTNSRFEGHHAAPTTPPAAGAPAAKH